MTAAAGPAAVAAADQTAQQIRMHAVVPSRHAPIIRQPLLHPIELGLVDKRRTDPTEWIAVARVPALVDQAQFDRVQERLAYNRGMARRNNGVHAYLLRGLVSCGHCRRACGGRHLRPGYAYYVCPTKTQRRDLVVQERCRARHIPARQLEDLVWRDLCQVLQHPQMIAAAMERARGSHWLPQELQARRATLRRGRAALGQQRGRLTEAYLSGVIPLGEYERRRREIEARLAGLERQEQQLAAEAARDGETAKLAGHVETFCRRVQEGLAVADLAGKRGLLELLVDRVVVTDGAVEIRYALPTGPDGEREPFCRLRSDYRAPLGPAEGVASHRNPLREDSLKLHGRPLPRSHTRLDQTLTGRRKA